MFYTEETVIFEPALMGVALIHNRKSDFLRQEKKEKKRKDRKCCTK